MNEIFFKVLIKIYLFYFLFSYFLQFLSEVYNKEREFKFKEIKRELEDS